jgi:arylsulfatase A-like enzyme
MKVMYPDYDNSLLTVASSILTHYGIRAGHKTLPYLDYSLNWNFRNVVLLVFDGMGSGILERHLKKDTFLCKQKGLNISSVFPPTTTAATTTLHTGLTPAEHGWLGWCLYFEEIGANVELFTNELRGVRVDGKGVQAADYNVAWRYMPYESAVKLIAEKHADVDAAFIAPYMEKNDTDLDWLCGKIKERCKKGGRNFTAAYWDDPDITAHMYGTDSGEVRDVMAEINKAIEKLAKSLEKTDTLLIITADHGLVDTEWRYISDYPSISECLLRPISMEPRAVNFFVRDGMKERFAAEFNGVFRDDFILFTRDEVLEKGLFGSGTPHKRTETTLGDFVSAAVGGVSIATARPTHRQPYKAHHAGLTEGEMLVPLIVIERELRRT